MKSITAKPKLHHCKVCRCKYTKRSSWQKVCGKLECAVEWVRREREKKKAKEAKAERARIRQQKADSKPLQYWLKRAQKAVNDFRRTEDLLAGYGCITCGTHDAEEWHCGHWISVGASSATRFDPSNLHLQCRQCNYFGAGKSQDYEARLPARIGQAEVDRLKNAKRDRKWTREECQAIEAEYKAKLKTLKST